MSTLGPSFRIRSSRIEKKEFAYVEGTISSLHAEYSFMLSCNPEPDSLWKLEIKLGKDFGYVRPLSFPKFKREDYPAKVSVWVLDNINNIINSISTGKDIRGSEKVVVDFHRDKYSSAGQYPSREIKGYIITTLRKCEFQLFSFNKRKWLFYVARKEKQYLYESFPDFDYVSLENKSIVKWIAENSKEIIEFSE